MVIENNESIPDSLLSLQVNSNKAHVSAEADHSLGILCVYLHFNLEENASIYADKHLGNVNFELHSIKPDIKANVGVLACKCDGLA